MRLSERDRITLDQDLWASQSEGGRQPLNRQKSWGARLTAAVKSIAFLVCAVALYGLITDPSSFYLGTAERKLRAASTALADVSAGRAAAPLAVINQQNPASRNAFPVYARTLGTAPGAIICKNYAMVGMMFSLYNRSWEDRMQDHLTKGFSRTVRGEALSEPDISLYGCALAPAGTLMMREPGRSLPIVTFLMLDGTYFQGVTMEPMIAQDRK